MTCDYYHIITVRIVYKDGTYIDEHIIEKRCYVTETCNIYFSDKDTEDYKTLIELEIEKQYDLYGDDIIFRDGRWYSVPSVSKRKILNILNRDRKKIIHIDYIEQWHDFICL